MIQLPWGMSSYVNMAALCDQLNSSVLKAYKESHIRPAISARIPDGLSNLALPDK
jgi:hypothetical protein